MITFAQSGGRDAQGRRLAAAQVAVVDSDHQRPGRLEPVRMNEHEARRLEHLTRAVDLGRQLPPDAVISYESAAILFGLPTYDVPSAVRVTRLKGNGFRTSDVHVHRAGLRPCDRTVAHEVPVTSIARTVVDLGRRLTFGQALVTADGALRAGCSRRQMNDVLRHQWTWPMVRRAMPVVRCADARSESALESWTRSRFITLQLPVPDLQRNIYDQGRWVARS